jgi:hypothetical protein
MEKKIKDVILLVAQEAAAMLGTTKDWLRRNGDRLPFTVRLSAGQVHEVHDNLRLALPRRHGLRHYAGGPRPVGAPRHPMSKLPFRSSSTPRRLRARPAGRSSST